MKLDWEYCECGCHGHTAYVGGRSFWSYNDLKGKFTLTSGAHSTYLGTTIGTYKDYESLDKAAFEWLRKNHYADYAFELSKEVYDKVFETAETFEGCYHVGSDLAYLMGAIVKNTKVDFGAHNWMMLDLMNEVFPTGHEVWSYVTVESMCSPDVLFDLLGLVIDPEDMKNITLEMIAGNPEKGIKAWTPSMRAQAEQWAGSVHLRASDHDDVCVPPKPDFLP